MKHILKEKNKKGVTEQALIETQCLVKNIQFLLLINFLAVLDTRTDIYLKKLY